MQEAKTFGQIFSVRAWHSFVQEIHHDGGEPGEPLIRAAVAVVFKNPFAGIQQADLSTLTEPSDVLGSEIAARLQRLLDGRPVESYGKGGMVGLNGEQEHIAACVTTVFGDALRKGVGGGQAWISSVMKAASAGTSIDIPLAFKDEVYVRSHYDSITFAIPDAPRPDELVICAAVASGPRLHARVGGLTVDEWEAQQSA